MLFLAALGIDTGKCQPDPGKERMLKVEGYLEFWNQSEDNTYSCTNVFLLLLAQALPKPFANATESATLTTFSFFILF